jgi:hypothetical protein
MTQPDYPQVQQYPQPGQGFAPPPVWGQPPLPQPKPRKVRKRRTGLLFSIACALGVGGGLGAGFAIQQHRSPTPLPSLYVALPDQQAPAGAAPATTPTPSADQIANDDQLKLDGDLRKLLLPAPAGSKPWDSLQQPDSWESIYDYSLRYSSDTQVSVFTDMNDDGFERLAETGWDTSSGSAVEVDLMQFHTTSGANQYFAVHTSGDTLPNSLLGHVEVWNDKDQFGDYAADAYDLHGDVVVIVTETSQTKPVTESTVTSVIEQQLGKL